MMFRKLIAWLLTGVLGLAYAGSALAYFHLWRINEIYSNADGSIQFLELICAPSCAPGETVATAAYVTVTPTSGSPRTYNFPSNLTSPPVLNQKLLLATQGFANLGIVTADYIIPDGHLAVGGGSINLGGFDIVSHGALPTDGVLSISRTGATATNSPTNYAGATGSIPAPSSLTVNKTGSGTVTSFPAGINCGATCSANATQGNLVILTARPDTGYIFSGWIGCHSASGNQCATKVNGATSVAATFTASASSANAVLQVAAGGTHTLAIKGEGTLWGWGSSFWGQLTDAAFGDHPNPFQIGTDADWVSVAGGYEYTVALKSVGTLWAWGRSSDGQLGNGSTTYSANPVQVAGTNWVAVTAGNAHTLALKSDGTLWAWGNNSLGQLGDGTLTNRPTPVQIGTATNWLAISAGTNHSVALRSDGTLWAWGSNDSGRLGDGTFTDRPAPVQIGAATNWIAIAANETHTIALKSDGTLWAWGSKSFGALGDGTSTGNSNTPLQIGSDTNWSAVSVGYYSNVARKADGTLWSWGYNNFGGLGDGTTSARSAPGQIGSATDWIAASMGDYHTVALKSDGTVWTWGSNFSGELGDGTTTNRSSPAQISVSAPDMAPDAFSFASQTGVAPGAQVVSNAVTVSGINTAAPISITGGEYAVNGSPYTSSSGTVVNGDTVTVRVQAAFGWSGTSSATLTIGGVAGTFNVTTRSLAVGTAVCAPPAGGLISWWRGEDTAGDAMARNAGALINGATFANGLVGRAFDLDGVDDFVQAADSASLDVTTQFTLAAWVYPRTFSGEDKAVISKIGGGGGNNGYQMGLGNSTSSTTAAFCSFNAAGEPWPQNSVGGGSVTTNAWSHIACTYDNDTLRVYVNGALAGSSLIGAKTVANTSSTLRISGDDNNHVYFNGLIDDAQVYNRALTGSELAAIANAGDAGQCVDSAPDAFAFSAQSGVAPGNTAVSNAIVVSGITVAAPVSVTGGEYAVNGGSYTSAAGTVVSGDTVTVRLTASSSGSTTTSVTLTIGGIGATFEVTTGGPDTTPPSVPTGLSAGVVSSSQIDLSWIASTDNVGVTAYQLYRDGIFRTTVTGSTSFNDTGLTASTSYSYTIAACDAAGNCSGQSASASATTAASGSTFTPVLERNWNMLGNALNITLDVATVFGGNSNIASVWKWDAATQNWAYYSPALTADQLIAFTTSRAYQVLTTIGPGEGYWVNALNAITLPAQTGTVFYYDLTNFAALPSSWNLIATSDNYSPHAFSNAMIDAPPPTGGVNDSFFSLWAWDAVRQNWYYYSPALENTGSPKCGLPCVKSYTDARGLLHFEDYEKTLGLGVGFWVNRR